MQTSDERNKQEEQKSQSGKAKSPALIKVRGEIDVNRFMAIKSKAGATHNEIQMVVVPRRGALKNRL